MTKSVELYQIGKILIVRKEKNVDPQKKFFKKVKSAEFPQIRGRVAALYYNRLVMFRFSIYLFFVYYS